MVDIVEISLLRYKFDTKPSDGEIVWGRVFTVGEAEEKNRAIKRLARMIESSDKNRHEYSLGNTLRIVKEKSNGAFNQIGEVVLSRDMAEMGVGKKENMRKAGVRLSRYLSRLDADHEYFCKVDLVDSGTYCYQLFYRHTFLLSELDKKKKICRLISGRKSAITRSINKAKKIRDSYLNTLLPFGYRSDERYISLLQNIPKQRQRLREAKGMGIEDIPLIEGGIDSGFLPYLDRILGQIKNK